MSEAPKYYEELVKRGRRALREIRKEFSPQEVEILRNMTPQQKLEVSLDLHRTAWRLKKAYLEQSHPDWSESQVQTALREAFLYGDS